MSNIERIIEGVTEVVKAGLEKGSTDNMARYLQVMRVLTYLKIICTQFGHHRALKRYKDSIESEQLLKTLIEAYL